MEKSVSIEGIKSGLCIAVSSPFALIKIKETIQKHHKDTRECHFPESFQKNWLGLSDLIYKDRG